jgi:hypothetical protein
MNEPLRDHKAGSNSRIVFWLAVSFGILIGLNAGFGVIIHDGKSWIEGAFAGFGFSVFGFAIMCLRYARKIAEMLSLIH